MNIYKTSTFFECNKTACDIARRYMPSLDENIIIFTEDKLTLSHELELLSNDVAGTFNCNVYTFNRFIMHSSNVTQTLSKSSGTMVIKNALLHHQNDLLCFTNISKSPNLASTVYELIAQLKSAKVTPLDIKNSIESVNIALQNKLHDIYILYSFYENFLMQNNYLDSNNFLSTLVDIIDKSDLIKNSHVILSGYSSITKQGAEIFKKLKNKAKNLDVVLVCGDNKDIYTNEVLEFFVELDKNAPILHGENLLTAESKLICKKLFDPSYYFSNGDASKNVSIYEADSVVDELKFICQKIQYEVINNGYLYSDFVLAIGSPSDYELLLERYFSDYNIPIFIDTKCSLISHPLSQAIISILNIKIKNFDITEITKLVSNVMFLQDINCKDNFINHLKNFSITRKLFKQPFEDQSLDNLREKVITTSNMFKTKDTVENFCYAIESVLENLQLEKIVLEYAEKLTEIGESKKASFSGRVYEQFLSVLTEIKCILKDTVLSLKEFKEILVSGVTAKEISLIPENADSVYIGNINECKFKQAKILFACGLNNNVPIIKKDTALLSDKDLFKLDEINVNVDPKIQIVNRREKMSVGIALMSFKDKLFLSYSTLSVNGDKQVKSQIIDYMTKIFSSKDKPINLITKKSLSISKIHANSTIKNYLNELNFIQLRPGLENLIIESYKFKNGTIDNYDYAYTFYKSLDELNNTSAKPFAKQLLNNLDLELAKKISAPLDVYFKDEHVSVSLIETYYNCPYKCFIRYGLGATEGKKQNLASNEIGTILHLVSELYFKSIADVKDEKSSDLLVDKILEQVLSKVEYSYYLKTNQTKYLLDLLTLEAKRICYNLYLSNKKSKFKPVGFEVQFSDNNKYKAIELNTPNGKFKVKGRIDRLDQYNNYFRIIDYKTSNPTQKYTDETFYTGNHIQLYMYMNAFASKNNQVAGGYYYMLESNYKSSEVTTMHGKTLDNKEIILASDSDLETESKSNLLDITVKKDEFSSKNMVSSNTMLSYMEYAKLVSISAINEMKEGVICPSPYKGGCEYCEYMSLCSNDRTIKNNEREVKNIKDITLCEITERQLNKNKGGIN